MDFKTVILIFTIILILMWILMGISSIIATINLFGAYNKYKNDPKYRNLGDAFWISLASSVLFWFITMGFVTIIFLLILGGIGLGVIGAVAAPEVAAAAASLGENAAVMGVDSQKLAQQAIKAGGGAVSVGLVIFLVIASILVIGGGMLTAISAYNVTTFLLSDLAKNLTTEETNSLNRAYYIQLGIIGVSILGLFGLIGLIATYLIVTQNKKKKTEEAIKKLVEIEKLKVQQPQVPPVVAQASAVNLNPSQVELLQQILKK